MKRLRAVLAAAVALASSACLPGDTRPEPGMLQVYASANDGTREGVSTADGWTVRFTPAEQKPAELEITTYAD